jgi:hypothetical protein
MARDTPMISKHLARFRLAWRPAAALALLLAAFCGCASVTVREGYQATPSTAFDRPEETALGRAFAAEQARHGDLSGFRLLQSGGGALMTRAALAERLLARIEDDLSLQHSWQLGLESVPGTDEKRIVWNGMQDSQVVRLQGEQGAGLMRRFRAWFYSLMPGLKDLL